MANISDSSPQLDYWRKTAPDGPYDLQDDLTSLGCSHGMMGWTGCPGEPRWEGELDTSVYAGHLFQVRLASVLWASSVQCRSPSRSVAFSFPLSL